MNDLDVQRAVEAAGEHISPSFRTELRATLAAELAGDVHAPTISKNTGPTTMRNRLWIGFGVAGVAAAAAIAVVVINVDDQQGVVVPATDAPEVSVEVPTTVASADPSSSVATTDAPVSNDLLLASLGDDRWVLDTVGGVQTDIALVPFMAFGGEAFITGFDGCNTFGIEGSFVDDVITSTSGESTTVACDDLPNGMMPDDGDQLVMSADGVSFDLVRDGSPRLGYTRINRLGMRPTGNDEYGKWSLGESAPFTLDFSDAGTVTFGPCGLAYEIGNQLTVASPLIDPAACLGGSSDRASSQLIQMLTAGPVDVQIDIESSTLYLSDETRVIRLTDVDPVLDPAGITYSAGALFGFTPGTEISSDEVLATVEGAYRSVDTDTGWYDVPQVTYEDGTEDCLSGREYRVLWWGDVSMAFWRTDDGGEMFWAWSMGDKEVTGWGDRRETFTPADPVPSGFTIHTDNDGGQSDGGELDGVRIGSTEAELVEEFGDLLLRSDTSIDGAYTYFGLGGPEWEFPPGRGINATVRVADGVVTGIGAALSFC